MTTESPFCRICLNSCDGPVLAPCNCTGTVQHVHESCLKQWLATKSLASCELCGATYEMIRSRRRKCVRPRLSFISGLALLLTPSTFVLGIVALWGAVEGCQYFEIQNVISQMCWVFLCVAAAFFLLGLFLGTIHLNFTEHLVEWRIYSKPLGKQHVC